MFLFRYIALGKPSVYQNNRQKLNSAAKKSVLFSWIFSIALALVTEFRILPNDEFVVHSMGMTLSLAFDQLHLYQILIFLSLLTLWVIYFWSYKTVSKNHRSSSVQAKAKKDDPKFEMLRIEKNMILSVTICYSPLFIVQSFRECDSLQLSNYDKFSVVANSAWNFSMYLASRFVVFCSLINCIIFNYHNKYVRRELFWKCDKTYDSTLAKQQMQKEVATKVAILHKTSTQV